MNSPESSSTDITKIVEQNINTLLQRKKQDREKLGTTGKLIGKITEFVGSVGSLIAHAFIFGIWIVFSLGLFKFKSFDPNFIILAMTAAIEAIFLTIFILIGQRHMNAQADKWAELDLQISLLTEHEVTRVLTLMTAVAKKMNIEIAGDKEIEELSKDVHPDEVLDTMEKASE